MAGLQGWESHPDPPGKQLSPRPVNEPPKKPTEP